jgi:hypothetical protein
MPDPVLSPLQTHYLDIKIAECHRYCQLMHAIINLPFTFHPPDPDVWTKLSWEYYDSIKANLTAEQQALIDRLK